MKTLTRVTDPKGSHGKHSKVHYEAPAGDIIWCGQSGIYVELEGTRIRVWHPTRQPVSCQPCIAKLRKHTAAQLRQLNGEQLEDIGAHIGTFLAKYTPIPVRP